MDVLKSLPKTKKKIAFVPEAQVSVDLKTAERYIVESGLPKGYAVAILFMKNNIKKWLIATPEEITRLQKKVA